MCGADKLIVLSDIEGLYDKDPHKYTDAKLINTVDSIDGDIMSLANGAGTARGTGGMITKLDAAKLVTSHGIDMYINLGKYPERLYEILSGVDTGTRFKACKNIGNETL